MSAIRNPRIPEPNSRLQRTAPSQPFHLVGAAAEPRR